MTLTRTRSVGLRVRNAALSRARLAAIVVFEWKRVRVKTIVAVGKGEGHRSATRAVHVMAATLMRLERRSAL